MSIAIIGAGIAGAACAQRLTAEGHQVVVFDKGRTPGGRMSSKRSHNRYLDLGAQYFTARDEDFIKQCAYWEQHNLIIPWQCRLAKFEHEKLSSAADNILRYIGVPSMQKPVQHLLKSVTVQHEKIDKISFNGMQWQLTTEHKQLGSFEHLVLALPQQQAAILLNTFISTQNKLADIFSSPALLPCWAVDIKLATAARVNFDAIFVKNDPLVSWLAKQNSKLGRVIEEHWLVHFTSQASQKHIEAPSELVELKAIAALKRILKQDIDVIATLSHRWLYAQQATDYPVQKYVYLTELGLGLCGDWLNGGRIENAFLSGNQLATSLVHKLSVSSMQQPATSDLTRVLI